MSGTDLFGPDGPGAGGHDEEELRILLHEAVPALASPEDRMEHVLARVERSRRRRRVAGLAAGLTVGLTAAVLTAAPALAPGADRGVRLAPAGSPAVPAPTAPTPRGIATPTAGTKTFFFPLLPEMALDLPAHWYAQAAPVTGPREPLGYLGTQPLVPTPSCTPGVSSCPLSGPLLPGGAVLTFRVVDDPWLARKFATDPPAFDETGIGKECAVLGGNHEITGAHVVGQSASDTRVVIQMTACLRQPSEPVVRQVQQVFSSIRTAPVSIRSPYADGPGPGTPTPAATP
ncbi:hypothetical protein ACIQOW_37580 [Kitasatospora sp. NPDC091335]|uniref:hypothetical protein n=1 Tax=Kitasatospora sp. NPDC091335 TaxID=3364085 RepID=UPI0037F5E735